MGEWRKLELAPLEGATDDHTAYEYAFGAEIDGVFVPAVTKSGGYIDHLIATGKQQQADEAANAPAPSTPTPDTTTAAAPQTAA